MRGLLVVVAAAFVVFGMIAGVLLREGAIVKQLRLNGYAVIDGETRIVGHVETKTYAWTPDATKDGK